MDYRPLFTWGGAGIAQAGDFRKSYIDGLRAADKGDMTALITFARS